MDARYKRRVKCLHSVCCQEQNSLEVLQQAQEDADQSISVNVVDRSLLKEHIRFVQQQDSPPTMSNVKNVLQLLFEPGGIGAQVSSGDHVEGALEKISDTLRRECLAGSRGPVQHCNQTTALARNYIINAPVRVECVARYQSLDYR